MIQRNLYKHLQNWKEKPERKPLILRGARQVGKTTLVKSFAQSFKHFIFLNLELKQDREYFENFHSIEEIVSILFLQNQINKTQKDVLIFIDEIQESPEAIGWLRYFYEEYPHIHVIAAGSLLEFSLKDVKAFPVGRVEYLSLFPISFSEFVRHENPEAFELMREIPFPSFAYPILLRLFHEYALIGGMPEVVDNYFKYRDLTRLTPIYTAIKQAYEEDVSKYASGRTMKSVIRFIIKTSPLVADQRIKFQNFGGSAYRSREVGEAMRTLEQAGFIYLLYPTTATEVPVLPDMKKSPRLQYLDTGLMNFQANIIEELIGIQDLNSLYRGRIIEHLVIQEVIAKEIYPQQKPMFWVREKRQAQSEIDLVFQHNSNLVPVEVKSGKAGTLRSLHQFMDRVNHPFAIRLLANQFSLEELKTPSGKPFKLLNLPYFLGSRVKEYAKWLFDHHLPDSP